MNIWMNLFPINMQLREQVLRMIGGAALITVALWTSTLWGWVGLYPLLTGLTGSSPVYRLLGINREKVDA